MPTVPPDVIDALEGVSSVGAWEPISMLLTAGPYLAPDVCLLSRREIDADPQTVRMVVGSRKARDNIQSTQQATLVVHAGCMWYLTLRLERAIENSQEAGYQFSVTRVLKDDIGIPTQPMTYRVEPWLESAEHWTRRAGLLEELRALPGQ